jgi:hypothetical protein
MKVILHKSTTDTKTDDSKLVTTDTVYVSPDGGDTNCRPLWAFPDKFATYHLEACVYSSSAQEKPINCAGSFDYHQHRSIERPLERKS